ncbi:hypothetical protein [Pseudochrobactrum sp. B5]|uniref:hypothetical protein n=1 Tax=Pseudochrobactrum sp. B5 TaxID=1289478 RepID=UPI000951C347|nr:hypothetical protein [Pseudochrobactrum sp. B5]
MFNPYDQTQVYEASVHASLCAVREGFPHLTIRDIVEPPHQWFDAALARQIVMHILIREFGWPKRRVVEQEARSREAINRALRTIDDRMQHDRFASHYMVMAERARSLLFMHSTQTDNTEAA